MQGLVLLCALAAAPLPFVPPDPEPPAWAVKMTKGKLAVIGYIRVPIGTKMSYYSYALTDDSPRVVYIRLVVEADPMRRAPYTQKLVIEDLFGDREKREIYQIYIPDVKTFELKVKR
jgi:hypothetical protein